MSELNASIGAEIFSGNKLPQGAEPLAQAMNHQFNFSPQLGDGRALLLGEIIDKTGKRPGMFQLKGWSDTVFTWWRWQGSIGPGTSRIPNQRGDVCPWSANNTFTGCCFDGRKVF